MPKIKITCDMNGCSNSVFIDKNNKYKNNEHYIICDSCKKSNNFYQKSYCKDKLYLTNNDLQKIRYMYNDKLPIKLYLEKEIIDIINKKKDDENYDNNIKKRNERKRKINETKIKNIENRKNILNNLLCDNKLQYIETDKVKKYINYGKSTIEEVFDDVYTRNMQINSKRLKLINLYKKFNLIYNEKSYACQEYFKLNNRSLDEILKIAKIEDHLIKHTNYLLYLDKYDHLKSINIAIHEIDSDNYKNNIANKSNDIYNFL